jgi:hypothetical protein
MGQKEAFYFNKKQEDPTDTEGCVKEAILVFPIRPASSIRQGFMQVRGKGNSKGGTIKK